MCRLQECEAVCLMCERTIRGNVLLLSSGYKESVTEEERSSC
jgi:hypothetical protein